MTKTFLSLNGNAGTGRNPVVALDKGRCWRLVQISAQLLSVG